MSSLYSTSSSYGERPWSEIRGVLSRSEDHEIGPTSAATMKGSRRVMMMPFHEMAIKLRRSSYA